MPTDISHRLSAFDKFATHADRFASRAWFFALCVVLVVVWAPSFFLLGDVDTWQLVINTLTTSCSVTCSGLDFRTATRTAVHSTLRVSTHWVRPSPAQLGKVELAMLHPVSVGDQVSKRDHLSLSTGTWIEELIDEHRAAVLITRPARTPRPGRRSPPG
ncbi:MAG TPA: low affinity iron permease family protein [Pseudonocardiaceae bacterium]|jgi:hypothetical protein|nr:low affinity iron permease family protein [Pseudonocardiaceae bacterium]